MKATGHFRRSTLVGMHFQLSERPRLQDSRLGFRWEPALVILGRRDVGERQRYPVLKQGSLAFRRTNGYTIAWLARHPQTTTMPARAVRAISRNRPACKRRHVDAGARESNQRARAQLSLGAGAPAAIAESPPDGSSSPIDGAAIALPSVLAAHPETRIIADCLRRSIRSTPSPSTMRRSLAANLKTPRWTWQRPLGGLP